MDRDLIRFYGFSRPPFGPVTGPAHLFDGGPYAAIASEIVAEVRAGRAILAVRGEPGAGKTSLMHLLAWELQAADVLVVRFNATLQSPAKVQRLIGEAGIVEGAGLMEPAELLRALRARRGVERLVLLIDDANALSVEMFRYLWLLAQLFHLGRTGLSIVLLGGTHPWPALASDDLQALRQAMASPYVIVPLREQEAAAYLDRKLRYAGRSLRRVMTKAAMLEVFEQAGGVPARLEEATERVMLDGFARGHKRITVKRLRQVFPVGERTIAPATVRRGAIVSMASGMAVVLVAVLTATVALVDRAGPFGGLKPLFAAADRPHMVPPPPGQDDQGALVPRSALPAFAETGKAAPGIASETPPYEAEQPAEPHVSPQLPGAADQDGTRLATASPTANDLTADRSREPEPPGEAATPSGPPGREAPSPESATGAANPEPGGPAEPAVVASNQAAVSPDADDSLPAGRPLAPPEPSLADLSASPPSGLPSDAPASRDAAGRPEPASGLGDPAAPAKAGAPGLVVVAGSGDSMATLYAKVYRGLKPPPYPAVVAINRLPVKPGDLVIFPQPPDGWSSRTN
jgi:type II secretory pathway predicted ATPase ExeA